MSSNTQLEKMVLDTNIETWKLIFDSYCKLNNICIETLKEFLNLEIKTNDIITDDISFYNNIIRNYCQHIQKSLSIERRKFLEDINKVHKDFIGRYNDEIQLSRKGFNNFLENYNKFCVNAINASQAYQYNKCIIKNLETKIGKILARHCNLVEHYCIQMEMAKGTFISLCDNIDIG